jgi:hypothetical protein
MSQQVKVGVGSSIKPDDLTAAREAAELAVNQADGVEFGFVFFSALRNASKVASGVAEVFGEKKFMGHGTYFQINPSGFFHDSVSVLAINSESITLSTGIGEDVDVDAKAAGRTAVIQALKDLKERAQAGSLLGMLRFNPYTCLMFTSRPYDKSGIAEEGIIDGMMDLLGPKFSIIGSTCSGVDPITKSVIQPGYVICNGKAYSRTVVCGILSSKMRVGVAIGHGFTSTQKLAVVTRSAGNIVYELNGEPALKAYASLLGVSEDELRRYFATAPFLRKGPLNGYAFAVMDVRGEYWLRSPRYSLDDDSLFFTTEVKPGTVLVLMETDELRTLRAIGTVAGKAATVAATQKFAGSLSFNCSTHRLVISDLSKEFEVLKRIWGVTPFLVAASGGEQGAPAGGITGHTNMACVTLLFTEEPFVAAKELSPDYIDEFNSVASQVSSRMELVAEEEVAENAEIRGRVILDRSWVRLGEEVRMDLELVNVGKGPATLQRVENVAPKTLSIKHLPEASRLDGDALHLKQKQLSHLETVNLRIIASAGEKGDFIFRPRIFYRDEGGKERHYDPDPAPLSVRELGISGWLKGRALTR